MNPYQVKDENGNLGKYKISPRYLPHIRLFAMDKGYKYNDIEDFLNNPSLQDRFYKEKLEGGGKVTLALGGTVQPNHNVVEVYREGGSVKPKKPTRYVDNPNHPSIQAYKDSLDLYNYSQLQHKLEPENSQLTNMSLGLGFGKDSDYYKNQVELLKKADEIIKNNPNISYGDFNFKGDIELVDREYFVYSSGAPNSPDLVHKLKIIKPNDTWIGGAMNYDYIEPKEPVEYKPNNPQIVSSPNPPKNPPKKPPKKPNVTPPIIPKPTFTPNPKIVAKQQQLIDAGFDIGKADGIWGDKSKEAWEEYTSKQQSKTQQEKTPTPQEQPIQTPPIQLNTGERRIPHPNAPNIQIVYGENNTPLYFENKRGDRIPYDKNLKGITPQFQYQYQDGGKVKLCL